MTARPDPVEFAVDDFLVRHERKSLLRFIVCGSVDHGKSTLIGRLLYEGNFVPDDQLKALRDGSGDVGEGIDGTEFALLLDGLAAEREQKITIDVAYRFFTTDRRKFIVADAPGHEHYTRNMATAASTSEVALLVVSIDTGLTRQTRRHALILSMLGVRNFVVAVNKMDLAAWSRSEFERLEREFRSFANDLDLDELTFVPVSARSGDNVIARSERMDWYGGPTLLEHLERVEPVSRSPGTGFRMPVQYVNRPDADFRGYSGLIAAGEAHVGMNVRVLPSGQETRIARIVTADGDLDRAVAGQAVTLTVADEIDASRGDLIAEEHNFPALASRFAVRLISIAADGLVPGRSYVLKLATCTAHAVIGSSLHCLDLDTRESKPVDRLRQNDIGSATLDLDRPIACDRYAANKDTGSFILIDPVLHDTVGMGTVEAILPEEEARLRQPVQPRARVVQFIRSTESHVRSVAKAISWRGTASLDTFVVALLITGSSKVAGGVALAEIVTKIALYYLHERIWALVPWGRRA